MSVSMSILKQWTHDAFAYILLLSLSVLITNRNNVITTSEMGLSESKLPEVEEKTR
jgi:hypothetical protein